MLKLGKYRIVVVRYDDPRGGIYRGPLLDSAEEAKKQLELELSRVHGTAWIEEV